MRPGGAGMMASERAGTERPERRVETLAPTKHASREGGDRAGGCAGGRDAGYSARGASEAGVRSSG